MCSRELVMRPCLPKRKMMDSDKIKGGDNMGSVAMVLRKPLQGTLVRVMVKAKM